MGIGGFAKILADNMRWVSRGVFAISEVAKPLASELQFIVILADKYGEPDRVRTCDNLIKSQVLYQLSYGPSS